MVRAGNVILVPAMYVVLILSAAAPLVWAAPGDTIAEFKSQLQTTPTQQGWFNDGNCLLDSCPGMHVSPPNPDPPYLPCYYQGWGDYNFDFVTDNSCLLSVGCRKSTEHYNAPPKSIIDGTCTFSEWIAFDNGIYGNPSFRPLTMGDAIVPGSPPFGATRFPNAPIYPALRIVTGDGNLVPGSLPVNASGPTNNRNQGRARVYKSFHISEDVQAVTMLCKVAAGPRPAWHDFIRVRAFQYRFTFGVDGDSASSTFGRITYGDDAIGNVAGLAFGAPFDVPIAVAQPKATGSSGQFFTLRAILRSNGTFEAYLNERIASEFSGQIGYTEAGDSEISLTPEEGDDTMWFDYVQLFEGAIQPTCPQLVFDFNRNGITIDALTGKFDEEDFNAFQDCATGPADATGSWNGLSADCRCFDVNEDESIDMEDFAVLQRNAETAWRAPVDLLNGDFEASAVANPPADWTTYIQSAKSGNWTLQTVTPPEGTQWQQTQVYDAGSWGGVRQNVTGLTSGTIYTIYGSYKTNSTSATASVRFNLTGDINRTNSTVLASKTNTNWTTFSGTVTASGTSLMLFLDHLNSTFTNKASAFDNIKITGMP